MVEEEGDAAAHFAGRDAELERPDEATWPSWSFHLRTAFFELKDDRHYGAMGGLASIYFTAIDRYALRFGIAGSAFDDFLMYLRALDNEFIAWSNEKAKEEAEKRKHERGDT